MRRNNGQGTISTDSKGSGPGYYRFYDRWKEEETHQQMRFR